MIDARCPNGRCPMRGQILRLDEQFIGRKVKCVHCGVAFRVTAERRQQAPAPESGRAPGAAAGFDSADPAASATPMIGSSGVARPGSAPVRAPGAGAAQRGSSAAAPPVPLPLPEPEDLPPPEPPPLPPRPNPGVGGLRVGPLVVSLMSATAVMVSLALIVLKVRGLDDPPPAQSSGRERWAAVAIESGGVRLIIADGTRGSDHRFFPLHASSREWSAKELPNQQELDRLKSILADMNDLLVRHEVPPSRRLVAYTDKFRDALPPPADKNEDLIKRAVEETMKLGREPELLAAAREAEFGARGIIPIKDRTKAVYLDIGGSSAKFGYFHSDKDFRGDSSDLGVSRAVREIGDLAKARNVSFAVAARLWKSEGGVGATDAAPKPGTQKGSDAEVRELFKRMPQLRDGENYHLLGGTCWAVSVLTRPDSFLPAPDDRGANVALSAADIAEARALAEQYTTAEELKAAVLAKVRIDGDRQHLEEELRRVGKDFPHERLLAGITILKSYADVCQMRSDRKTVQFFVRSMHAWPIGYMTTKGEFEK